MELVRTEFNLEDFDALDAAMRREPDKDLATAKT